MSAQKPGSWRQLLPEHVAYLEARGITPEIAAQRGYISLMPGGHRRQPEHGGLHSNPMGLGKTGGLGIPLQPLLNPDADVWQIRIPDDAVTDQQPKFRSPKGQRNVLCTHPATRDAVTDTGKPTLVIAEGVTRVDTLAGLQIPAIGITGCWGWRNGQVALPDFDAVPLKERQILIALDGDITSKPQVWRAMRRLAGFLDGKGAIVFVLNLPDGAGIDDFIAEHQPADASEAGALLKRHIMRAEDVPMPEGADKPHIEPGTDYSEMLASMTAPLLRHNDAADAAERWYAMGSAEQGYTLHQVAGATMRPVPVAVSRKACAERAKWGFWRLTGTDWHFKKAKPDPDIVKHVIKHPDTAWPKLERLSVLPELTETEFRTQRGYDEQSATLWDIPADINGNMDVEDAKAALWDVFGDFPFADQSGYANLLAVGLTPFVGALSGRGPGLMVDAPSPGTGKTLMADCLGIIVSGKAPQSIRLAHLRNREETPKQIASALSNGKCLRIDNMSGDVDDPGLAEYMTGSEYSARKLGVNDQHLIFDTSTVVTLATANNPTLTRELADRFLNVRLDAKTDNPRVGRTFRIKEPLDHYAKANRIPLVNALASLARSWHDAGRPAAKERPTGLGSFDQWRDTVADILDHADILGFATNLDNFKQRVATSDDRTPFVQAWWEAHGGMIVGTKELAETANIHGDEPLIALRGGTDRAVSTQFGKALSSMVDRTYRMEDGTLVQVLNAGTYQRATQYRLDPAMLEPGWNG